MAKLTSRHTVTEHFVEEGTQGLHYCRLEERRDEPPPAGSDLAARLEELHAKTRELARRVIEPVTVRRALGRDKQAAAVFMKLMSLSRGGGRGRIERRH